MTTSSFLLPATINQLLPTYILSSVHIIFYPPKIQQPFQEQSNTTNIHHAFQHVQVRQLSHPVLSGKCSLILVLILILKEKPGILTGLALHQRHREARTCRLVALLLGLSLQPTATPRVLLRSQTPTPHPATVSSLSLDRSKTSLDTKSTGEVEMFCWSWEGWCWWSRGITCDLKIAMLYHRGWMLQVTKHLGANWKLASSLPN